MRVSKKTVIGFFHITYVINTICNSRSCLSRLQRLQNTSAPFLAVGKQLNPALFFGCGDQQPISTVFIFSAFANTLYFWLLRVKQLCLTAKADIKKVALVIIQ